MTMVHMKYLYMKIIQPIPHQRAKKILLTLMLLPKQYQKLTKKPELKLARRKIHRLTDRHHQQIEASLEVPCDQHHHRQVEKALLNFKELLKN